MTYSPLLATALLLMLAACDRGPSDVALVACGTADSARAGSSTPLTLSSIAGEYELSTVGRVRLPCRLPDARADALTLLSGRLVLDSIPPDTMVPTPGAYITARSCVHSIPNGAWTDTAGVVHLPDGSTYVIPKCGQPYVLSLRYRYTLADGRTRDSTRTTTSRHVWGPWSGAGVLRLVSSPIGSFGTISVSEGHIELGVYPVPVWEPAGPEYQFIRQRE